MSDIKSEIDSDMESVTGGLDPKNMQELSTYVSNNKQTLRVRTCLHWNLPNHSKLFRLNQVQSLLQGVQDKFQNMSDQIISRIDDMGARIDDLEKSIGDLMTQAGVEQTIDSTNWPPMVQEMSSSFSNEKF